VSWIDISTPLTSGMDRWPEDPEVRVERWRSIERGDAYNLTVLSMSAHTGTHIDAPLHYLADGLSVDRIPPELLVGEAVVVDARPVAAGRLLFRLPELTPELAREVVRLGVRLVGVGSMNVGTEEVHRLLLGAGVTVVEGLQLGAIEPGRYELVCLPLRLAGAEGAPARALLRRLG
jgi:arylformamidase